MHARHPHLGDAAPVTVTVESKFMQGLRVATAVNPAAGLASVRSGRGGTEFFSIGSDQAVHHYHPDPGTASGYAAMPLGICADAIAVTLDAEAAIVVFAAHASTLTMVTEQPGRARRWGPPVQLQAPLPPRARSIAALHAATDGHAIHLALLFETHPDTPEAGYHLVLGSIGTDQAPMFVETGLVLGSLNGTWMGDRPSTMRFVCDDGALVAVTPAGHGTRLATHTGLPSLGVAAAVDGLGKARLFAVLADGNAYQWLDGHGGGWAALTQGQAFTQIAAEPDGRGAIHLLCVGAGRLWHLAPAPQRANGHREPTPIPLPASPVSALTAAANDDGGIDAFTGHAAALHHLAWNGPGRAWEVLPVEADHGEAVEAHAVYGGEVQLRDAGGAPLAWQGVTITATGTTHLSVNGATYRIDAHRAAQVCTNGAGRLHIQQPARALAVPTLLLSVPGLMPPGEAIAISLDMAVQAPLAALTGATLVAATTHAGAPLLPQACRTPEQAAAIASAISQLMGLAAQGTPVASAAGARLHRPHAGVRVIRAADGRRLRRLAPHCAQHWRFAVVDGVAQFQPLSAGGAQAHLASLRATSRLGGGFVDVIDGIDDLGTGAAHGLLEITETVVTTAGGVTRAAVRFVVDGSPCLLETALTTVDQLLDLAQAVFAQVKVYFQALHGWLGASFDWPAIVRTARALNYTAQQLLGFLQGAIGAMQAWFDHGRGPLPGPLCRLVDQAIRAVGHNGTGAHHPSDADRDEPDGALVQGALSNNPIFQALLDHAGAVQPPRAVSQALATARSRVRADPHARGHAPLAPHDDFIAIGALLHDMLTVLRGLVEAAASGQQADAGRLLRRLQTLVGALTTALNAGWKTPVLSPLFRHATGGMPMNTMNLVSVLLAISATALCEATEDRPPFASDADLAAFEGAWDANALLRASGLRGELAQRSRRAPAGTTRRDDAHWTRLLPPALVPVVAMIGAVAPHFCAHLGSANGTRVMREGRPVSPAHCNPVTGVASRPADGPRRHAADAIGGCVEGPAPLALCHGDGPP